MRLIKVVAIFAMLSVLPTPTVAEQVQPSGDAQAKPPQFDRAKIKALLDKRERERGRNPTETTAPAGTATSAGATTLTEPEILMLRTRIASCWNAPPNLTQPPMVATIRLRLERDGSLAAAPQVINPRDDPGFSDLAARAVRAVRLCAPYTMLPEAKYNTWKEIIVDFDPRVAR
jgi:hypothetical protein